MDLNQSGGCEMRKQNKSVWLTDQHLKFLDRYGQQFSSQLREDLDLLEMLIDRGRREITGRFTIEEVCIINNAVGGTLFHPRLSPKVILKSEVDSVRTAFLFATAQGLRSQRCHEEDGPKQLISKIECLTELGALACILSARLFWATIDAGDRTTSGDELIKKTWPGM